MDFNKRTKVNALLLAIMPITWEFWQVWKGYDKWDVNWFLCLDYPMNIQWYMHDLGQELSKLLFSILVFRMARLNTPLRIVGRWVMLISAFGVAMFFVNYNRFNYVIVYSSFSVIAMLVTFFKEEYLAWWNGVRSKWRRFVIRTRWKLRKFKRYIAKLFVVDIPLIQHENA